MGYGKDSILTKYFYPLGGAITGVGTAVVGNYYAKRPYWAGIQRHIAFGLIGAVVGYYVDQWYERKWAERDAVIKHYIELHPEDFVVNRRKYKEVFDEWYPKR